MTPYAHIRVVLDAVRDGLHRWVRELMADADIHLDVVGTVPQSGGPRLAVLPYQMVFESQQASTPLALVPGNPEAHRDSVPIVWRMIGRGMTDLMLDAYPKRPAKGPGLGPLDPCPPLSKLPAPIAAWYRAHGEDWMVDAAEPSARLPSVTWRQPFALAVRYAALVIDPDQLDPDADRLRLTALGLLAAGVKISRYVKIEVPEAPADDALLDLVRAFAAVPGPHSAELTEAAENLDAMRELAVGLTPHHDLSDADLALVAMALGQPMQPAFVFSVRMALGGGAEFGPGAMPHLRDVEGTRP